MAYVSKTYKTDAPGDGRIKRVQDVHSWAQPLRQSLIATMSLVKFVNLFLEYGHDGVS
jgi:hypothetical protein